MIFFEVILDIKRPLAYTFNYMTTFSNHQEIFSTNIHSVQTSDGPVTIGTTMKNTAKFMGIKMEEHFKVVEYAENAHIKKESMHGSTFYTWDKMIFSGDEKNTRLTVQCYAEAKGRVLRLFEGMLGKHLAKTIKKDLSNLKYKLEQNAIDAKA
jgi:hypothetical protein